MKKVLIGMEKEFPFLIGKVLTGAGNDYIVFPVGYKQFPFLIGKVLTKLLVNNFRMRRYIVSIPYR